VHVLQSADNDKGGLDIDPPLVDACHVCLIFPKLSVENPRSHQCLKGLDKTKSAQ
jgi:hypothetical protein